jgi:hypothetical protein
MKHILLIALMLASFSSFAAEVTCGGAYAVGLGHFMKGESRPFADVDGFRIGETVEDEFYKATAKIVKGKPTVEVKDKATRKALPLTDISQMPGVTFLSSSNLYRDGGKGKHPQNIPGQVGKKVFLLFICGDM